MTDASKSAPIVQRVWNYCNILRDDGMSYGDYLEQLTYLLFLKMADEQVTVLHRDSMIPEDLGWRSLLARDGDALETHYRHILTELGSGAGLIPVIFRKAQNKIQDPAKLRRLVDLINGETWTGLGIEVKGAIYEGLLEKNAQDTKSGAGQYFTPRPLIEGIVDVMRPEPGQMICDPACGTAGFLISASEYVRDNHPDASHDEIARKHFHNSMFHGFDFDSTMLRIGSMNMLLHDVEAPDIRYRDSLSQDASDDAGRYTLVLANPPFAGSLDYETTSRELLRVVRTKKTELLFVALFLRLLRPGGRAAVIVPDGVLFGTSKAPKELRRLLIEDQKLDAVVKLPSGVFRPYAGVSTAILLFTRTDSGGTDNVWFYEITADGWSLDDKRTPLLDDERLGPTRAAALTAEEHARNNLPDVVTRWAERDGAERERARTEQSFCVPKADIVAEGYELSLSRYKESHCEQVERRDPLEIIAELETIENEIRSGLDELKGLLA